MSRICSILYIFLPIFSLFTSFFFLLQTSKIPDISLSFIFRTVQQMPLPPNAGEFLSTLCHLLKFTSSLSPPCASASAGLAGDSHNTSTTSRSRLTPTFQHSLLNTTTRTEIHFPSRWRVSVRYKHKNKTHTHKKKNPLHLSKLLYHPLEDDAIQMQLHSTSNATNLTKDLYLPVNHFIHERSGESPVYGLYLTIL